MNYELKDGKILKDGLPITLEDVVIDLNNNYKKAKQFAELKEAISLHQGTHDEETDTYTENPNADLCTIGELVLDELGMWM